MIERQWQYPPERTGAFLQPGNKPFTHVTWQDPAGDCYVGKPGDHPDNPDALLVIEAREDGTSQVVLCGRPVGHPEAELERHTFRKAA